MRTAHALLLLLGTAPLALMGCAHEEQTPNWDCHKVGVPMGGAVECTDSTSSAVTYDGTSGTPVVMGTSDGTSTGGSATGSTGTSDGTASGGSGSGSGSGTAGSGSGSGTSDGDTIYFCSYGSSDPVCPPISAVSLSGGSGSGSGTSDGSGSGGSATGGSDGSGSGSTTGGSDSGAPDVTTTHGKGKGGGASGTPGSNSNGSKSGGPTSGSASSNGSGSSAGGSSSGSGTSDGTAPECNFATDLSYCPPDAGGSSAGGSAAGTGAGSGSGTTTGGSGSGICADGPCHGKGNGATKGNGGSSGSGTTTGGTTGGASDSTGGSGTNGGGPSAPPGAGNTNNGGLTCVVHDGHRTCQQTPTCCAGTHPTACGTCEPDGAQQDSCQSTLTGGCWITGGGYITEPTGDKNNMGGNGKPMKDGTIKGEWNNIDHSTGNHMHGNVTYLYCRHINEPGPGAPKGTMNQAFYGGPARYRVAANQTWADGYWYDVMAKDHGEGKGAVSGGPDYYHITIRLQADPAKQQSGTVVYEAKGDWGSSPGGGNFQIHMPNNGHPYTASAVPQWILPLEN